MELFMRIRRTGVARWSLFDEDEREIVIREDQLKALRKMIGTCKKMEVGETLNEVGDLYGEKEA